MTLFRHHSGVCLDNTGVIITGASSGIGRALAEAIARKGGRLVLAARGLTALRSAADAMAPLCSYGPPLAVPCDVRNEASVEALIQTASDHLGSIDVLINNAGTCIYGAAARMSDSDVKSMLGVHVLGPYYGMRAVIPHMERQGGGLIVNVASVAALHGVPYLGGYGAAKAAQVAFSQSLRAELQGTGIRIMVVCPNYTDTNLFNVEKHVGGARRPRGHYQSVEDVASTIVKAIEKGHRDLVLSIEGKMLHLMRSVWPGLVELVFNRMAMRLKEEYRHA